MAQSPDGPLEGTCLELWGLHDIAHSRPDEGLVDATNNEARGCETCPLISDFFLLFKIVYGCFCLFSFELYRTIVWIHWEGIYLVVSWGFPTGHNRWMWEVEREFASWILWGWDLQCNGFGQCIFLQVANCCQQLRSINRGIYVSIWIHIRYHMFINIFLMCFADILIFTCIFVAFCQLSSFVS